MGKSPDLTGWQGPAVQAGILHFLARLLNREKNLHLCKIAYRFDLANTKTDQPHSVTIQSAQPVVRSLLPSPTGASQSINFPR
jgi:hypothetical protein